MKAIQVGDICIWQNVPNDGTYLNGKEVTAMSALKMIPCCEKHGSRLGYETDEPLPGIEGVFGACFIASPHMLRLKDQDPEEDEEPRVVEKPITEKVS